jgi:hypothetical protein
MRVRPCSIPGCKGFQSRKGRCDDHQFEPWHGSNRRTELPKDWPERRRRVLRRDGYRCQAMVPRDGGLETCGAPATEVDHIEPGDDHSEANLRSLCRLHHGRKSAAEGVAARRRREAR